jgi:cytochrome P450
MLGFAALFLARNPDHRHQLIQNPDLIPAAAEELLRRFGPSTIARVVTRDVVVHGVQIKEDEQILLPAFLHGLDEIEYEDPLTVNFSRAAGSHGSFGFGPHRCPGSILARTELKIFLEEWLKRIPDFRVKPGAAVRTSCGMVNGLLDLPLEWDV